MKYGKLIVETREYELIKRILSMSHYADNTSRASLSKLKQELEQAERLEEEEMPLDVIRFNSMVTIKTPFNIERPYQLVTPEKSDIARQKISILAPMGSALFGYAKGDEISWQFPTGLSSIKILDVVQQEKDLKVKDL